MSAPDHAEIGYECENGHVNADHDIDHAAEVGSKCVCTDCGGLLTRKLLPLYECDDCGNVWAYTGDADRPSCSNCRGKRTHPAADD
jgi:hypothetical protein